MVDSDSTVISGQSSRRSKSSSHRLVRKREMFEGPAAVCGGAAKSGLRLPRVLERRVRDRAREILLVDAAILKK